MGRVSFGPTSENDLNDFFNMLLVQATDAAILQHCSHDRLKKTSVEMGGGVWLPQK